MCMMEACYSIHMKVRGQAYGVVYSYFAWSLGLEPGLTGQPSHQLTFTLDLEDSFGGQDLIRLPVLTLHSQSSL